MVDLSSLPDDHFVTSAQFTRKTYRDAYPSIDPKRPEIAQTNRLVVITGASQGLGREAYAKCFAEAGARALVLVARNEAKLNETAALIRQSFPAVQVLTQAMDVADEVAVASLFDMIKKKFGSADVLVNNAAHASSPRAIRDIDLKEFWLDFNETLNISVIPAGHVEQEVNVKGALLMSSHFLKVVGDVQRATIINITSHGGIAVTPTLAGYSLSKMAQIQLQRFIASENPKVKAVSLHPGIVVTAMTNPDFARFSKDTPALSGGTALWLASDVSDFMNGRYMEANWSVDELVERRDEIERNGLLTLELNATLGSSQFNP